MKARGLTLIEILVAIALATIIVGIVAASSVQVQTAIGTSQTRLVSAAEVRALFVDIEQDLARMVPATAPNPPFTGDNPIQLERPTGTPIAAQANDPTGFLRYADKLRVFSTINTSQGTKLALLEYSLDTTGTSGTPDPFQLPGNGLITYRVRRRILKSATLGTTSLDTVQTQDAFPVLCDHIMSFEIEYVDGKANDIEAAGSAGTVQRTGEIFLAPDQFTADGSAFLLKGKVQVNPQVASAKTTEEDVSAANPSAGSPDTKLLTAIPLGGEIRIFNSDYAVPPTPPGQPQPPALPTRYVVRQRHAQPGPPAFVDAIRVNDRVIVEKTSWTNKAGPPPPLDAMAFIPPQCVRVSLTLAFGKRPESGQVRFSRLFPISR